MDFYGFYTGKEFEAYRFLGAHVTGNGTMFRTFAPNARQISVIGSFNDWQETPMQRVHDGNFWECYIDGARNGMLYKYRIYGADGGCIDHCDPYGFYAELRPRTASIIFDQTEFSFTDADWLRKRTVGQNAPMNIYELHAGSWRRKPKEEGEGGWYTYRELADLLIPYLEEQGYQYVELMPLSEHPCDESWGYQNTGFFAPTSRYGTPDDLRYFVNACHMHRIGVFMDFVPVHFAVNDYALWNYDGSALYEYPNRDVAISEWGSCNFMHSRGEVRSFLQSAAMYWLAEFHFDGLRMDAVSNLIYWQGDASRGVNKLAVSFLQNMNAGIKERFPNAILMAEDSSSYEGVTKPVFAGGLGFDYKWDMGWMNDTLNYFRTAPEYRSANYHKLTFSMMYYYRENYLLPLSHDEVVHGKATIIQKMNGDYEQKFPQARALYLYMYAHPGKKLNFMGNEIAQFREWDEKREQDWDILTYPKHDEFHRFMKELNRIYKENPAFWESDYEENGFTWLDCHQEERCIYAFERRGGGQRIAVVLNLSDQVQNYDLKVPDAAKLTLLLTGDDLELQAAHPEYNRPEELIQEGKVSLILPPFGARYYVVH